MLTVLRGQFLCNYSYTISLIPGYYSSYRPYHRNGNIFWTLKIEEQQMLQTCSLKREIEDTLMLICGLLGRPKVRRGGQFSSTSIPASKGKPPYNGRDWGKFHIVESWHQRKCNVICASEQILQAVYSFKFDKTRRNSSFRNYCFSNYLCLVGNRGTVGLKEGEECPPDTRFH